MGRSVKDAKLETRTRRALLCPFEKHWRMLTEGRHIGYRKGKRGGKWLARWYDGTRYVQRVLGPSDDSAETNGALTYAQALEAAQKWFEKEDRRENGGRERNAPLKVGVAADEYLEWAKTARKGSRTIASIIRVHIKPELGDLDIEALTPRRLRKWLADIAERPARFRARPGQEPKTREALSDGAKRARKASANRAWNVLRAILNRAYEDGDVDDARAWERVSPFEETDAGRPDVLSEAEAQRLPRGCPQDFRQIVQGGLYTGARWSELVRMRVRDFYPDQMHVHVAKSKGGRARDIPLWAEGVRFFKSLTAGRAKDEFMFRRSDGERWGETDQVRRMPDACKNAEVAVVGFHALRHSYATALLLRGMPLLLVSKALGHTTTRRTEKNYAHVQISDVAKAITTFAPDFGASDDANVVVLRTA